MSMKLYILDNGWMEGDENWIVTLKNYATKDKKNVQSVWRKFPVYSVLLDTPNGKILYDTGHSPDEHDKSNRFPYYYTEEQRMINQLALANTKPDEISKVVMSHLHDDHCGNLKMFANADIYISKDEYNYVKNARENNRQPKGAYKLFDFDYPNIHLVDEDLELIDNVRLISLPGHSCGLLGLIINLEKDGTIIFPMDAVDTKDNYGPPVIPTGGVYNNEMYYDSIEKVRKLQEQYNAKVFFSHDIEQYQLMKKAPEYYE